jgi:hypothetical protein
MNELIRRRREEFDVGATTTHVLMCECPDPGCTEMLEVPADELDEARADDALFVVAPAHAGGAKVVLRRETFCGIVPA